ncbi:MAG: response regulator [Candidatus Omnitrophota bacterium]
MAKVLIIDDDPDIVESIRVVLESQGYGVTSAFNGLEGLTRTKKEKPDLIILDIMMPKGMDGFEIAREIKKDPQTQRIPILMLTAIKDKTGLDFQKEAGDKDWLPVEDYCAKPLNHDALLKKVSKLLGTK